MRCGIMHCLLSMLLDEMAWTRHRKNTDESKKGVEVLTNYSGMKIKTLYTIMLMEYKNDAIRPNQIFAISLPFRLLKKEKEKSF